MKEVKYYHRLKTWSTFFWQIVKGEKRFELRRLDRKYEVGDYLLLEEYDLEAETYSGFEFLVRVESLLKDVPQFGLDKDFCIMTVDVFGSMNRMRVVEKSTQREGVCVFEWDYKYLLGEAGHAAVLWDGNKNRREVIGSRLEILSLKAEFPNYDTWEEVLPDERQAA